MANDIPKYKCIKEVHALKIEAIELDNLGTMNLVVEKPFPLITLDMETSDRFKKAIGTNYDDAGYYVIYKDGYVSWSPTKAFEEGYRRI